MLDSKETLVRVSAVLLVAGTAKPLAIALVADPVLAQSSDSSTAFPLPSSLPSGTTVKVDGSSSMTVINEALKKRFEEKFPGSKVDLASSGTDEALKALQKGDIKIAAVGRPLTDEEKAQGLVAFPISREKIAIIVGSDNPFKENLTFEQFAKIFRGEITDWSQLGASPGPIRFVDRPEFSDTRRSLSNYKVFRDAKFATGTNATQVPQDDTATVVRELRKDGISYAIASQVLNQPNVRVIAMHNTLPSDPRYPYSQLRAYVYKQTSDPGTQAFLGFATSPIGQEAIKAAKAAEATTASPSPAQSPEAVVSPSQTVSPSPAQSVSPSQTASPSPAQSPEAAISPSQTASPISEADAVERGFPWWLLLLLIPLLGGLLWWLLKGRRQSAATDDITTGATGITPVAAVAPVPDSRLTLTPRNCREAEARWEVPDERKAAFRQQGGQKLALRLYDVTDIDIEHQTPQNAEQFDGSESQSDLHVPIAVDNRDYVAELGYITNDDRWLRVARSTHVRVPACPPIADIDNVGGAALAGGAAVAAGVVAHELVKGTPAASKSRITLTPRNDNTAYASWEAPPVEKDQLKRQGGQKLTLRLYDATDIDIDRQTPHTIQQFDCDEQAQDRHIPVQTGNRDYIAELGHITDNGHWLKLARSAKVRFPAAKDIAAFTGGAAAVAVGAAAAHGLVTRTPAASKSRMTFTPRGDKTAQVHWEVPQAEKDELKRQGGQKLALRLYDATDIDIDRQTPRTLQQFECDEQVQARDIPIPVDNRDYVSELGYVTNDDRWLKLASSARVRVPAPNVAAVGGVAEALGATALATSAGATAIAGSRPLTEDKIRVTTGSCAIKNLVVHNKNNCYLLGAEQMSRIETETGVSKTLIPGRYIVRIKSGAFSYDSDSKGEPLVMLWIYGGKFINKKTNVPVEATWSTLNGYAETLTLEVLKTTTLCAFFFDTNRDDNVGEVTLSVIQFPSNR